jgi:hypothetical protein
LLDTQPDPVLIDVEKEQLLQGSTLFEAQLGRDDDWFAQGPTPFFCCRSGDRPAASGRLGALQ